MKYIIIFLTSFLLSFIITPSIRNIVLKFKLVAYPKEGRWHKEPIALLGGIAIYLAFITSFFIFQISFPNKHIFLLAGFIIFIWGIADDIKNLKPHTKLLGQIIVSAMMVDTGIVIKLINSPFLAIPLTILWIVLITNSFNLLDNMDGLACGVAFISSIMIAICSFILKNYEVGVISLILSGASLGFLPFNFNPAKIFMGDCGSMFLGFSLASLTISGTWRHASNLFMVLFVPVLILAVPIFDTIFVALMRKLNGKSIYQGGVDHTSHRLVYLGMPEKKAVFILYVISAIFGLTAIATLWFNIFISIVVMLLVFIITFLFALFLAQMPIYKKTDAPVVDEENIVPLNSVLLYKRHFLEVLIDMILICASYLSAYLIRYDGIITSDVLSLILKSLPIILIVKLITFFRFGLYSGIWKYVGIGDLLAITKAVFLGSIFSALCVLFLFTFKGHSRAAFVIDALILLILISASRILLRVLNEFFVKSFDSKEKRVLIFGAGDAGEILLRELKNNNKLNYKPLGFIDDDKHKIGKQIHGIPILGNRKSIIRFVQEKDIDEIIVAIPSANGKQLEDILTICKQTGIPYREMSRII
ncbi:MAG: hypothetical protein FJZ16_06045 [Candidatus Omnitrophica bacterium]|nr:hypothetical protein [Candidatus Omnitrophota bacterium]